MKFNLQLHTGIIMGIPKNSEEIQNSYKVNEEKLELSNGISSTPTNFEEYSDSCLSKNMPEDTLEKQPLSYIALIAKAILSSPTKKLKLADIYKYIEKRFPFYTKKRLGWKNSIRHNLSLNDCFIKVGRCEDGKGNYWSIHPTNVNNFVHGNFKQCQRSHKRGHQQEYQPYPSMTSPWGNCSCLMLSSLYQMHSYFSDQMQKMRCADGRYFANDWQWLGNNSGFPHRDFSFLIPSEKANWNPVDAFYGLCPSSTIQQNVFLNVQQTIHASLCFSSFSLQNRETVSCICENLKECRLCLNWINAVGHCIPGDQCR